MKNNDKDKFILNIYDDTRRFLRRYKDKIIITEADKGNKTVLMYKKDYYERMDELLKDRNTYKRILIDPTQKLQRANNNLIMDLYKKEYISIYDKRVLTSNAATAPRLYGLPKIHKLNNPLRPISSSVGVPCYELSKHIGKILKNIIQEKYNIRNSLELKMKLDTLTLDEDEILISLDVVSLFTNIPIHLAISNIMAKWSSLQNHTKIPGTQFLKILQFCLNDNNYFVHDDKLYHRTYGMPMGNPLSPTVADIILDCLLDQTLAELQEKNIKIKLITGYVDDLFAIIEYEDEDMILKTSNSYHNKLKFTLERETDNSIPYLDMRIHRNNQRIITDWYMKPIASGRLLNFHSTQPMRQKMNTAMNLINKVMKMSDRQFEIGNMARIKIILRENDFPNDLVDELIIKVKNGSNDNSSRENDKEDTSGNAKYYSIPFIPRLTENNKLREMIKDQQIIFAHKPNRTIDSLFTQTRTKIECREQGDVVYQIECDGGDSEVCGKVYIGTTKRNLGVRIDEHKADIKREERSTALSQHCIENGHRPNFERVKILDKEKRENGRYTLESLRIRQKSESAINTKEDKDNTNAIYTIAIF
ncbi:uncharacterized protein LOC135949190 [Calliphora vicina]|uniref:uncharacterized protein LOC135949190 n=1 Tax=Calliphora vicina TaxID=7373 RepID=UPI00325AE1E6